MPAPKTSIGKTTNPQNRNPMGYRVYGTPVQLLMTDAVNRGVCRVMQDGAYGFPRRPLTGSSVNMALGHEKAQGRRKDIALHVAQSSDEGGQSTRG